MQFSWQPSRSLVFASKPEENAVNAIGKLGVFLILVGFLAVGSAALYGANASPESVQDAAQVAKSVGTAQGVGWIVAGIGLVVAFAGLYTDLHDLKTVGPQRSALETSEAAVNARKVPKEAEPEFVCSDCGRDISADDKVCPHCGALIEGE